MKKAILKIIDFSDEYELHGTPKYMASEQVLGYIKTASQYCDVYAAGVVFVEILTLDIPFEKHGDLDVLKFHKDKKTLHIPQNCPEPIRIMIQKCLSHYSFNRPSFNKIVYYFEEIIDDYMFDLYE